MAKVQAVWGIDIGISALKALRCVVDPATRQVRAEAFDFVEYPKQLSQSDADATELVLEALRTFLSRNAWRKDKIVISVAGQKGLARFIKLPPVESSKVPDIVRYEAKQQIPFKLDDVVWDYQQIGGGSTEGFALDTEVGIFAIKLDEVRKVLSTFDAHNVEIEIVQLTPIALFNFALYDQFEASELNEDNYDPDAPPPYTVVLSMGTDSTDLVATNGFRVWQRNIAIGGSHFTKALVKELKMTFAKAEHIKRNAASAEDPQALFRAMRPVFTDLLTEVQRSLNYFTNNVDRNGQIKGICALGNVMKLPGLSKYLSQHLGHPWVKLDRFKRLTGPGVVDAPVFKENLLAYGVCYGLCLQGLSEARMRTNLLPHDIRQFRLIRAKKPWAAVAAALLMLGCAINYLMWSKVREGVNIDKDGAKIAAKGEDLEKASNWSTVINAGKTLKQDQEAVRQQYAEAVGEFRKMDEIGQSFLQNGISRDAWLQITRAVTSCLPRDKSRLPGMADATKAANEGKTLDEIIARRNELKVRSFDCRWTDDLSVWYTETRGARSDDPAAAASATPMSGTAMPGDASQAAPAPQVDANGNPIPAAPAGPKGGGWIIRLSGHHYHNSDTDTKQIGREYVQHNFVEILKRDEVDLPLELRVAGQASSVPVKKIGIGYPVIISTSTINNNYQRPAADGELVNGVQAKTVTQKRQEFEVQFCWQPGVYEEYVRPSKRAVPASAAVAKQP